MRLALIRRRYAAAGGAELYLQRLMRCLVEAGHEVRLFAEDWEGAAEGVKIERVPVTGGRAMRPRVFAQGVERLLRAERYDCVFSLERTMGQDVYRAGDGVHRVWLERWRDHAPWWRRWTIGVSGFHRSMMALEAMTFDPARTGRVIVNSRMVGAEIRRVFGFPEERIHLVRNGVEVGRFRGADGRGFRKDLGVRDGECLVLFVGSGWERKGLGYLLAAMRALRLEGEDGFRLAVVGHGRRPRGGAPPGVSFLGVMAEIERAYAAADLFVMLPIYEPSANACVEALAAGVPVITTRSNGAAEVVLEVGGGAVVERSEDVSGVVRAMREWRGHGRLQGVSEREVSIERNVDETVRVLELAAAERKARGGGR